MNKEKILFEKSSAELIRTRTSWRNYADQSIEEDKLRRLNEFMEHLSPPPFKSEARFKVVQEQFEGRGSVPGTYGVIKGAHNFIVGAVEKGSGDMEDFGYLFEHIVLLATDLNLGTCWMGGTFDHTSFGKKIDLKKEETLPAISPVGYRHNKMSLLDTTFKTFAGSRNRKQWSDLFFEKTFKDPLSEVNAGEYRTPLEMVRLAPSASNKQPWRVVKQDETFRFYLQRTKFYNKLTASDLQRVDIGIAMCHFELSAVESDLSGQWERQEMKENVPSGTEYITSWVPA